MGISDRLLGKKNVNGHPHITGIVPPAAVPGGEVRIIGSGLRSRELRRPRVTFGEVDGGVVVSSDGFIVARVPDGAGTGPVFVSTNGDRSNGHELFVAAPIAENLHSVANPAIDFEGNVYATFSGSRGQKTPVSVYRVDAEFNVRPFLSEIMNATAIVFDREGQMYVSSRFDGTVYRVAPNGTMSAYAESMGVATGLAFDKDQNLYIGDRSGTIFKVARDKQIYVFATLEPSVSAYHLAFGPDNRLYVTGPTTSSFDAVYRVADDGTVETFFRGLGRPQGMAFDGEGNLYVAASLKGKRGIVRVSPDQKAELVVSGYNIVGLAFGRGRAVIIATNTALYQLVWNIQGRVLTDV